MAGATGASENAHGESANDWTGLRDRFSQLAHSVQHEPTAKIALLTRFGTQLLAAGKPNGECRMKTGQMHRAFAIAALPEWLRVLGAISLLFVVSFTGVSQLPEASIADEGAGWSDIYLGAVGATGRANLSVAKQLTLKAIGESQDDLALALSYSNFGRIFGFSGDCDRAIEYYVLAQGLFDESIDADYEHAGESITPVIAVNAITTLEGLATCYVATGRADLAVEHLQKAYDLADLIPSDLQTNE